MTDSNRSNFCASVGSAPRARDRAAFYRGVVFRAMMLSAPKYAGALARVSYGSVCINSIFDQH